MIASLSERGSQILNIRKGEERALGLLFLTNFFIKASSLSLQTAGYALYLDHFGSEGLGILFIAIAIITPVPAFVYLRISRLLSVKQFLVGNYAFVLLGTGISYLGVLFIRESWLLFALPIWLEIHMSFTILAVWTAAGFLFDVRQSKRLFGLVESGAWLSTILIGFLIPPIVIAIGTTGLVGLSTVAMGLGLIFMILITRAHSDKLSGQVSTENYDSGSSQSSVSSKSRKFSSYDILIMGLVLVYWIGFMLTDFVFLSSAEQFFTDAEQLASIMALRVAIGGILGLVISTFFTSTILRRFGLRAGLLIMPVTLMLLLSLVAVVSNVGGAIGLIFVLGGASKVINHGFGRSIDKTSQIVLFQPLSDSVRVRIQTWAEAIIQPFAIGIGGFLLLVLVNFLQFGIPEISIAYVVVGVVWIAIVVRLVKQYPKMLLGAVRSRQLSYDVGDPIDEASLAIIDEGLKSSSPEAVIYAISLLEQHQEDDFKQRLRGLLNHPSSDVREFIVNRLRHLRDVNSIDKIRQLVVNDPAPKVKSAAVSALLSLGSADAFNDVLAYLDSPDEAIKQGALVSLLQSGGIDGILAAGDQLNSLLASQEQRDRIVAAQILGKVGLELFYQPLLPLLNDDDVEIRHAALIAASKIKNPLLWPYVIEALSDPSTRSIARTALSNGGTSVIPALSTALDDNNLSRAVTMDLILVCERVSTPAVTDILKDKIDHPASSIRSMVLRVLRQTGYSLNGDASSLVYDQIRDEAKITTTLISTLQLFEDYEDYGIIVSALNQDILQAQERIFDLLSFVEDRHVILPAQQAFRTGNDERQSYALELIDTLLPRDLKAYVLPIFDIKQHESGIIDLQAIFPQQAHTVKEYLAQIINNSENVYSQWVQACALYVAHAIVDENCFVAIQNARQNDEYLIQSMAEWANSQITQETSGGTAMAFSLVEKVLILKTVSIFSEVPSEILVEVADYLHVIDIEAGDNVFEKGDLGDSMYIIINGKVQIHRDNKILDTLDARRVFGELALLDDTLRSASVTTLEDTSFFKLEKDIFQQLMETQVGHAHGVIRVLMRYIRDTQSITDTLEMRSLSVET